jgi:hypothetical protein
LREDVARFLGTYLRIEPNRASKGLFSVTSR